MSAPDPDRSPVASPRRGRSSISHKLGLVFVSLGAATLLVIGQTYRTFDALGGDHERKEVAHSLQSSAHQIQLLTVRLLRGEDLKATIDLEQSAFRGRVDYLFRIDRTNELSVAAREALVADWETYSVTCDRVVAAAEALAETAIGVRESFAPWVASLSSLEAALDSGDDGYEEHVALLSELRSSSTLLDGAFFKLVSAPPGDVERQASLGLSVHAGDCAQSLALLRDGAEDGSVAPLQGTEARAALSSAEAAWARLSADVDRAAERKTALTALVHSSPVENLEDTFEALTKQLATCSSQYDARAQARRELLTHTLIASLAAVLLVIAAAMIGVRRSVVGPIRRLTEGTMRLRGGRLDAHIPVETHDELGVLAESFNAMAVSLAQSQEQLQTWAATLEEQVRERTEALRAANERLIAESNERERVEGELRLAQKLEAVGQLAAGIAHEINTPIQYINDNTKFLRDAFTDTTPVLLAARELAEKVGDGSATKDDAAELQRLVDAADLDFLLEETPTSLSQTLDGIDRVAKIVRAMKEFSHPGVDEMTRIDLNRAIEGTVTVASNEWKYVAKVELDLAPDLPPVLCLPGEINQVILNMIVNAAHAIGDVVSKTDGERGTIRIATESDGTNALIRISDTGTGIPEEIRDKIFDQFFTTKEVGRGTGQGLSIAHGVVVSKHGGSIQLESELGVGTTFIIRLPLDGVPAAEPLVLV